MTESALDVLIGAWDVEIRHRAFPDQQIAGRQTFEWVLGDAFVQQRVTVDHPDFPDAIGLLGPELYHYFDTRGVARRYRLRLADGIWRLQREDSDFWQRFTGRIGSDGRTIAGSWDMSHDQGSTWEHDLTMNYSRAED
jgi:hypothetical protein